MVEEDKSISKRKMQAIATRKKILDCAIDIVSEENLSGLSVRRICNAADISIGTFYNYFKSIDDIKIELNDDMHNANEAELLYDYVTKIASSRVQENSNPLDMFINLFIALAEHIERRGVEVITNSMTLQLKYKDSRISIFSKTRPFYKLILNFVNEYQEKGFFVKDISASDICDIMQAAFRGIIFNWCSQDGKFMIVDYSNSYLRIIAERFVDQTYNIKQK